MNPSVAIRRGYAQMADGQLHYRCAGDPTAPVLLLLHQAPSSGAMFETMLPELAGHFFCIAPDLPGCGQSDGIGSFAIASLSRALAQALQQEFSLGQWPLYLFGHHTGAAVATELGAYHWPETAALVLSGPPLLTDAQRTQLAGFSLPQQAEDSSQFLSALWQFIRAKDPKVSLSISLRETLSALQLGPAYRALYQAVAAYDMASALKATRCPVLAFAGWQDSLRPALASCQALQPAIEVAEVGDYGTYVCEQAAEAVNRLIIAFCLRRSEHGSGTS